MDAFDLDESEYESLPMQLNNSELSHLNGVNTTDSHIEMNESHLNVSHYDQHPFLKLNNAYHPKRDPAHRIFVNRSFQLSDIKFFGFDMDHTLAVYKLEAFDLLTFRLAIDRLVQLGYPKEIQNFEYDPKFAVRGLWFDKLYGNLLKVDAYGNIITCVHGFKVLTGNELYSLYPNKFITFSESRICVQHTLYEFPESYLLACIVDLFTNSKDFKSEETGVKNGDVFISFQAIYQDVRESIENLYRSYFIQNEIIKNIEKYIVRDDNIITLLTRIKENNAKAFLLTNADYNYADKVMGYMLNDEKTGRNWRSFFDYIVVDARKPLFFEEGTTLKEINIEKRTKNIGCHSGPFRSDRVYSGGNCDVFSKLINSHGKDVLYVGDHIHGDIIKSKKERAWHTFLIVPELQRELQIWHDKRDLYAQIELLSDQLSQMFINYDSASKSCPDISGLKDKLQALVHELDMSYSFFGSAFRTGSRQTFFASQVTRYADIYSSTCLNLIYYPFFYLFKSAPILMPHESTVNPDDPVTSATNGNFLISRVPKAAVAGSAEESITAKNALLKAKADALNGLSHAAVGVESG